MKPYGRNGKELVCCPGHDNLSKKRGGKTVKHHARQIQRAIERVMMFKKYWCPRCGELIHTSSWSWDSGTRYRRKNREVIWLCRDCSLRFNMAFNHEKTLEFLETYIQGEGR